MNVAVLGAAQCIGKSMRVFSFEDGFEKIVVVVDAGMDPKTLFIPSNKAELFPDIHGLAQMLRGATALHIIITHAHLDHGGGLPVAWEFIRAKFPRLRVVVHMTKETWALLGATVWNESLRTMANVNDDKPEWDGRAPFFTEETIKDIATYVQLVSFEHTYELAKSISFTPRCAVHILGAMSVDMTVFGERIFDTGDISFDEHPFISAPEHFSSQRTRLLVSEGTAAGEYLDSRKDREDDFAFNVKRIVMNKSGIAVIPAFQLDRAQTIAEILVRRGIAPELIRIDGGARYVTRLYKKLLPEGTLSRVGFIKNPAHREQIIGRNFPCVIIASGGMMHGIALWWAKQVLPRECNGIFINGWYEKCTPADKLMQTMNEKVLEKRYVEFESGELISVRAEVHKTRLSAHAHGAQLEDFWMAMNPQTLLLNHAEAGSTNRYLKKMQIPGILFPKTRNRRGELNIVDF